MAALLPSLAAWLVGPYALAWAAGLFILCVIGFFAAGLLGATDPEGRASEMVQVSEVVTMLLALVLLVFLAFRLIRFVLMAL